MNRNKYQSNLKYMILSALFAAMIYVMTAFVHIPTQQGYVHIGDGIIYLAAALLPMPYAMSAAAIGAGLSDYLSGYAIWVLPTVIIKAATAAVFTSKKEKILDKRNLLSIIPAGIICVGGYYVSGVLLSILSGSAAGAAFASALADIPTNIIQVVGSAVLFIVSGGAFDKSGLKHRLDSSAHLT